MRAYLVHTDNKYCSQVHVLVMLSCLNYGDNPNRPVRQQDSRWSYLVCACATFCQAINMGLLYGFGVLFPTIIKRFNSSRQETGVFYLSICQLYENWKLNMKPGSGSWIPGVPRLLGQRVVPGRDAGVIFTAVKREKYVTSGLSEPWSLNQFNGVWKGGHDPAFPLLFQVNPASCTFFIAIPKRVFPFSKIH